MENEGFPLEISALVSALAYLSPRRSSAPLSWRKDVRDSLVGGASALTWMLVRANGVEGAVIRASVGFECGAERATQVFEVLKGMLRMQRYSDRENTYFILACRGCSRALAQLLEDERKSGHGDIGCDISRALLCCVQRDHLSTVRVLLEHMRAFGQLHEAHHATIVRECICEASRRGSLELVRLMFEECNRPPETLFSWRLVDMSCVLKNAGFLAHSDMIKWVAGELDIPPSSEFWWLINNVRITAIDAAAISRIDAADIADMLKRWAMLDSQLAMCIMVARGRLDVVKQIRQDAMS